MQFERLYRLRNWLVDGYIRLVERVVPVARLSGRPVRALEIPEAHTVHDFTAWRELLIRYRRSHGRLIFELGTVAPRLPSFRMPVVIQDVDAELVLEFFFPQGGVYLIFDHSIWYLTSMDATIDDVGYVIDALLEELHR